MRILLTRASDEAQHTAEKLKAAGHQVVVSPVLEMQPGDTPWPAGVVDAVIATSAAGFELARFALHSPLPETRHLMRLFVVGEKTAEAAQRLGFLGELMVASDAKALAEAIIKAMRPPARLAYLAGRDRKGDLEIRCKEAGLEIIVVEVYEARAAEGLSHEAVAHLKAGEIDAVLHYSRRSAEIFMKLAKTADIDLKPIRHMAISSDAAAPLLAADFPHVMIATEPKELAIFALLSRKVPTENAESAM